MRELKKHQWGKARGFSAGVVDRIFRGQIPGHEVLNAISMYDNVSLTWLVSGLGSPYLVFSGSADDEVAEQLQEFLSEKWSIVILSAPSNKEDAIVLMRPSTYEYKEKEIEYLDLKILVGPIGLMTSQLLKNSKQSIASIEVSEFVLHRITRGQSSNSDILKHVNTKNYKKAGFTHATKYKDKDRRSLPQIETLEEKKLILGFRSIEEDDKKTILNLIDSLTKK